MMSDEQRPSRQGFRFPAERRHVLKDEERRRWLPAEPILAAAGIAVGETVIDIGAGTGFWTLPLAQMVGPSGKVFAVDVEPIMLDELRDLAATGGPGNIEVMQSTELQIPLPDGIADAAVLGFVLHEPSDTVAFVRELARLLRPGGRAVIVDWQKHETEKGPPLEHRIPEDEAVQILMAEGYSVDSLEVSNPDVYVLLARRD